jgi:hypothetical protein
MQISWLSKSPEYGFASKSDHFARKVVTAITDPVGILNDLCTVWPFTKETHETILRLSWYKTKLLASLLTEWCTRFLRFWDSFICRQWVLKALYNLLVLFAAKYKRMGQGIKSLQILCSFRIKIHLINWRWLLWAATSWTVLDWSPWHKHTIVPHFTPPAAYC